MTAPRSLKDLFLAALEVAPEDRAAWLERECGADAARREHLDLMLAAHDAPQSLLDRPAADALPPREIGGTVDEPVTHAGTVIGPYKLLEQIGEGGMGSVWMAQQTEPVKRLVALKLIKAGMDSKQVIARFEAERQALALMDHPNIARVIDGGDVESSRHTPCAVASDGTRSVPATLGRPYFVMDLVKGVPITKYCDDHHLTPRQRLELFIPVCQAVQHAHQKGIIHRDLKPSNVLVALYDGKPVPKVIDFGVAKAAGQPLTEQTLVTGFGAIVGTLEYMSPEQAETNQLDIDTRSDIYSLGVLLYELLTGSPPFSRKDLEKAGMLEMLRVIREEEPSKPSTKLSTAEGLPTLAANRGTEPAKLTKLVRGELDWIVMKALEKDRNRRYESATGFASDVQRYLADEPVLACPPSAGYRFRKFARRNKGGLSVAALVLFFLILLGGGIGWAARDRAARDAEVARQRAERQAKVAGQVELILQEVERLERQKKWPEALDAARRAVAVVAGGEADEETAERVRGRLRDLAFIDRLEQIRLLQSAWADRTFDYAAGNREYARAFREYGVDVDELPVEITIARLGARPALAIPLGAALDDWVEARRVLAPGDGAGWKRLVAVARGIDPEPLRDRLRSVWGRPVSEVQDDLRRLAESVDVRAHPPATLVSLALTLRRASQTDAVIRLLRDARHVHPGDFWLIYLLGVTLSKTGDYEGAVRFYTAAVAVRPNAAPAYYNLGNCLHAQKKLDEAITCYRRAVEIKPKFARAHSALGVALHDQRKLDEAVVAYRQAIESDPQYATAYNGLGITLIAQKKLPEAIAAFRTAIEIDPEPALRYSNLALAHYQYGESLRSQGKLDDAIAEYRQVLSLGKKKSVDHGCVALSQFVLPDLLNDRAWQLVTGGDPKFRDPKRAIEIAREALPLTPDAAACWRTLGVAHYRAENWKAAVEALGKARKQPNPHYRTDSVVLFFLSMAHGRLNEHEQARTLYDQAAQWRLGIGATEEELRRFCAEAAALLGLEVPPALKDPPVLTPGPAPITPAAGATLDNGSSDNSKVRVWGFDWSDVPGATRYHLYVTRSAGKGASISNPTLASSSFRVESKGFVVDRHRLGYRWRVRALVNGVWSDWSEERTFDVAPLADNKPPPPKK